VTNTNTTRRTSDRDLIEALRARVKRRKANQPVRPTVDQVATIVDDLVKNVALSETGARMRQGSVRAGERLVLDVVATFGTWLAHSVGRADVTSSYAVEEEKPVQTELFPAPRKAPKRRKNHVVIPEGYEPSGPHKRDVDKALCTIVAHRPDAEVIARFVARTYTTRQSHLGYPVVAGVWGFARHGRLASIDLVSEDIVFQTQVLEGFDVLDVGREDAIRALAKILDNENASPKDVLKACDRAFWLDEQAFQALRKVAEFVKKDPSENSRLRREIGLLRHKVAANPGRYRPSQVSDLTLGQVRRICEISGIRVEPENRAEETEIRNTLKSMGFSVDADRLVPEALRCADSGTLDAFWEIMHARSEGDPDWSRQLQELSAAN
jgi:transposase-like protein